MLNRREVMRLGASVAATGALFGSVVRSAEEHASATRIVDTNVSLFHWPYRRLPLDETSALVEKFRLLGISQAWAGSFEGLLHRDISEVNQRLVEACRELPELVPIGTINPTLSGWQEDLRRCVDDHKMPGVRVHPNYHGYTLNDPRFSSLLARIATAGCFVQIVAAMEDERTQHQLLRVNEVELAPLAEIMPRIENARVQILGSKPIAKQLASLATHPGVFFDTSRVEGTDGVPQLVENLPPGRVMYGSNTPFLITEAALIRVHESGQLSDNALCDVFGRNSEQLLQRVPS